MGIKRQHRSRREGLRMGTCRARKRACSAIANAGPKSEPRLNDGGRSQTIVQRRKRATTTAPSIRTDVADASAPSEAVVEPDSEDVHVGCDGNRRLHKVVGLGAEIEEIVFGLD